MKRGFRLHSRLEPDRQERQAAPGDRPGPRVPAPVDRGDGERGVLRDVGRDGALAGGIARTLKNEPPAVKVVTLKLCVPGNEGVPVDGAPMLTEVVVDVPITIYVPDVTLVMFATVTKALVPNGMLLCAE